MDTDFQLCSRRREEADWKLSRVSALTPQAGRELALQPISLSSDVMKIRKARPADAAIIADVQSQPAWETEKLRLNRRHR